MLKFITTSLEVLSLTYESPPCQSGAIGRKCRQHGRAKLNQLSSIYTSCCHRAAAELNSSYMVRHGSSTTYELGLRRFQQVRHHGSPASCVRCQNARIGCPARLPGRNSLLNPFIRILQDSLKDPVIYLGCI